MRTMYRLLLTFYYRCPSPLLADAEFADFCFDYGLELDEVVKRDRYRSQ